MQRDGDTADNGKLRIAGAQSGGAFRAFAPPRIISKHCLAMLTFAETFKDKDGIWCSSHLEKSYLIFLCLTG